jgi:phospholipase D-like protein
MTGLVLADSPHFSNIALAVVVGLLVLLPVVFFIGALVSILSSPQGAGMKLVWIIFAFCAPFLGPLLWFVVGRRQVVRV